jgi:ribosome maturation protein Sdo1
MSSHADTCQVHNANPPWACTCGEDLRQCRAENQQLREVLAIAREAAYGRTRKPYSLSRLRAALEAAEDE